MKLSMVIATQVPLVLVYKREKVGFLYIASPQQGDLRILGSLSGRGTDGGARICNRRVPGDLRPDSQVTQPPTGGVGGTVACESALRSAGTLLSRVRATSTGQLKRRNN
ncbi:hypothetical protein PoB_007373000 [Plakobranchus ocellatus]|uniref:Uncharacterized protein n=1 Tax=Plakobranchus ocellatus TaxID=259542 RepID=A0AAV4DTB4_9GAST|nr:hypothetical protein PoB_007373000 [Plakobranchus ocellatus]